MDEIHAERLTAFSPPGNVNDLSVANRSGWSKSVADWIDSEIGRGSGSGHPLTQFFNPTVTAYSQNQQGATITWNGFPNKVMSPCFFVLCSNIT